MGFACIQPQEQWWCQVLLMDDRLWIINLTPGLPRGAGWRSITPENTASQLKAGGLISLQLMAVVVHCLLWSILFYWSCFLWKSYRAIGDPQANTFFVVAPRLDELGGDHKSDSFLNQVRPRLPPTATGPPGLWMERIRICIDPRGNCLCYECTDTQRQARGKKNIKIKSNKNIQKKNNAEEMRMFHCSDP